MANMEKCLRDILDDSPNAVYVTDLGRNLLYANQAAKAIAHAVLEREIVGKKCHQVLLGRSEACPFCRLDKLSAERYTVRCFSGATGRVFELQGRLIDWGGTPAHIEYVRDITAQSKAEKRSEELELQQKDLFEHVGIGMCLYQVRNGEMRAIICNSAYRQLFQLPDEFDTGEAIRLQMKNFFDEDRETLRRIIMEHIRKEKPFQRVCRIRDIRTGLPKSVLMNLECAPQGDGTTYWYVSAYDVTDWENNEQQLNRILRDVDGGIAVITAARDGRLTVLMHTDGIAQIHGCTPQEYDERIRAGIMQMVYPEDRAYMRTKIIAALAEKGVLSMAYRGWHKEKKFEWIHLSATPIGEDADGCMHYSVLFAGASREFELYQQIVDIAKTGVLVTDRRTGEVYYSNRTADQLLDAAGRTLREESGAQKKLRIGDRSYQADSVCIDWMERPSTVRYFSDITEEVELREKLTGEEERYRMVVEESKVALMDYDIQHGKTYMNELFRQYAISREDPGEYFDQHQAFSKVHPEDLPKLQQFYEQLRTKGIGKVSGIRLAMTDGSYRYSELHGIEPSSGGQSSPRKICFIRDIDETARQYAELQARYNYEIAKQDSFEEGVVEKLLVDLTDDRVLQASGANGIVLDRVIGLRLRDLLERRLIHTQDERERKQLGEFMNRETLLRAFHTMEYPVLEMKQRVPGMLGKQYFRSAVQCVKNPENDHVFASIVTRNVDRVKTEEDLMRRLLETNYDTVLLVHAATGRIKIGFTKGDESFTVNIEETYDELAQRDIRSNVIPENQEQVLREMSLAAIREALRTTAQCSGRTAIMRDGKMVYRMWTAAYFAAEEEFILMTTADATEVYQRDLENGRKLAEALESARVASEAKSTFLARMSHEIRTPITTISGILELIRRDHRETGLQEDVLLSRVKTAMTANQYLLTLVNDILDISKVENGELTLDCSPADIEAVVRQVMTMARPLAEQKHIRFVTQRRSCTSNWYRMDAVRVAQILMNLLSNAIKFTPEGGTITFTGEAAIVGGNKVLVTFVVSDTGVGISKEFIAEVFEPFKQEYSDNRSKYGGTGIGLSISRSLARLMGGDITAESEKGRGATFTATMELEIADERREEKPASADVDLRLDHVTVLLCEDNAINQMIAKQLLEKQGCKVLTADDGRQGVAAFAASGAGDIDCILMDVRMPQMDGLEAASAIRSLARPDAATVPIIAMSANAYEEDRQLSLKAGMNDHLSKPVDPNVLFQTVKKYLSETDRAAARQ